MKKLSTGQDSTLGNYRDICATFCGEDSRATRYFDDKIKLSPNGRDEEVIADERQMVQLIASLLEG